MREILPELLNQIIFLLTSEEGDQEEASQLANFYRIAQLTLLTDRVPHSHRTLSQIGRKAVVRDRHCITRELNLQ